jgi:hypothetical protein
MKKTALLLPFLLCALAHAQTSLPPIAVSSNFRGQGDAQGNQWGELTISMRIPAMPSLQGAAFSGKEERKSEQLLPDGGRVTQPTPPLALIARDVQGRTRVERTMGATLAIPGRPPQVPLMLVEINDVVEGYYYILDPAKKVAHRVKYPPVTSRSISRNPSPLPPIAQATLIPGGNPQMPEMTTENLGTKFIQGVQAEGRRQTMVYPVGSRGNDRPMTEIHETWTVPSLELIVLSTNKSPTGNNSQEITNLSTLNPTPDLFRPPPGYEVRDQPATFTVEFGVHPPGAVTPGIPR